MQTRRGSKAPRQAFVLIGMEYFDVVDEKNKVIGKAPRDEVHAKGLYHRAVTILVISSEGKILIGKRSVKKDLYKGFYQCVAGHLSSGESYAETAKREMKEEIGIVCPLKKIFEFKRFVKDGNKIDNEFVQVFSCVHNGPFTIDKNEFDYMKFFSIQEIKEILQKEKVTPSTRLALERYMEMKNK